MISELLAVKNDNIAPLWMKIANIAGSIEGPHRSKNKYAKIYSGVVLNIIKKI